MAAICVQPFCDVHYRWSSVRIQAFRTESITVAPEEAEKTVSVATLPRQSQTASPLTTDHHQQIAAAHQRARKIRKAAKVAAFNGWVTGFFAVCSAPFAIFSVSGFLVFLGLAVVATLEFRGRKQILAFQPRGASLLGWNQVGFLMLIIAYCIWMIISSYTTPPAMLGELSNNPDVASILGDPRELQQMYQMLTVAVYGSLIFGSILFQGWNAYYYFRRRPMIESYLLETPTWIRDMPHHA